eukprot:11548645-Karenia_brevis.AAC.1
MAVKPKFQKQNLQLSQLESRFPRSLVSPSFSHAYLWNGETHVLVQGQLAPITEGAVSYTHLRAHETLSDL